MRIAVIGPMEEEVAALQTLLTEAESFEVGPWPGKRGRFGNHEVFLFKSGIGKVLSSSLTQALIMRGAEMVLLTGVAGAIAADLKIGDVVIGDEAVQHDLDVSHLSGEFKRGDVPYTGLSVIRADRKLVELALQYRPADGAAVRRGRILSGDQFLGGNRDQYPYLAELNGDVVEMEGAAVGLVCHLNHIPWVAVRTVSDLANGDSQIDFHAFLPTATKHSVEMVKLILDGI